jgi:hypothetical protein
VVEHPHEDTPRAGSRDPARSAPVPPALLPSAR